MKKYECTKCYKEFRGSNELNRHLERKFPCVKLDDQLEGPLLQDKLLNSPEKINLICKRLEALENKLKEKEAKLKIREAKLKVEKNKIKNTKTQNNKIDNSLSESAMIKDGNNNKVNNTKNIDNSTGKTTIINLTPYNNPLTDHITRDAYKDMMYHGGSCINELIKKTYFDKAHPENHTIYAPNIRGEYISVYNGDEWIHEEWKDFIGKLFDNRYCVLYNKYEEINQDADIDQAKMNKYRRFVEAYENDDVKELDRQIRMLFKTFINNRSMFKTKSKELKP